MDELEKNGPDEFWRKVFDEAAETPPDRVWNAIERQLDESNGLKVLPLWSSGLASSRLVLWGTSMAATLALLLVGWWLMDTSSTKSSMTMTQLQPSGSTGNVVMNSKASAKSATAKTYGLPHEPAVSVSKSSKRVEEQSSRITVVQSALHSTGKAQTEAVAQTMAKLNDQADLVRIQPVREATSTMRTSLTTPSTDGFIPVANRMAVTSFTSDRAIVSEGVSATRTNVLTFEQLRGKPLRMRSLRPIQRIVWFQTAEVSMEPELSKERRKKREMWASVSAMPNAFNPMVSIRSAQSALKSSMIPANNTTNQGTLNSRASFSVAYQAGAGVQLNERWSVESGIGYLVGHSTVETPIQATSYGLVATANLQNAATNNLYVDALRNSTSMVSAVASVNYDILSINSAYRSQTNYSDQVHQTLTNNYQYMQVPVQVGYQLRPRKRLSLAVIGGLLTNIFVRNTVGSDVVITARDGVYRPVSLAATIGARFRYRPDGHWSASLAGLYQPSLSSGTQSDSQVQSQPTSTGMSFGVDYHF